MSLTQEDVELLSCPLCLIQVLLTSDFQGLECPKCHRIYPIKDDIPQMIVEEAIVRN